MPLPELRQPCQDVIVGWLHRRMGQAEASDVDMLGDVFEEIPMALGHVAPKDLLDREGESQVSAIDRGFFRCQMSKWFVQTDLQLFVSVHSML